MRNLAALYYKAVKEGGRFRVGVSEQDGVEALIRAIAGSARGNNRNNDDGLDDRQYSNSPVCGKGHYSNLAVEMSSIFLDVNIIQDVSVALLGKMK